MSQFENRKAMWNSLRIELVSMESPAIEYGVVLKMKRLLEKNPGWVKQYNSVLK